MSERDPTNEELAREMAAIDEWSEERLAAVRQLASELSQIAADPDSEKQVSGLIAAGRPIRDWVIYVARQEAERNIERARVTASRTRTSSVTPCTDYDPREFWKAYERFKAALAGLRALPGSAGTRARAAALVAFQGGPLPTELPEWERDLVGLADRALAAVRTALSIPAEWGGTTGGPKSLKADVENLQLELDRFDQRVAADAKAVQPE
jgi:hypothetical protein